MKTRLKTEILSVMLGVLAVGCGDKQTDVALPPPPPPQDVTVTANADVTAAPPGAPNQPPPPSTAVPVPDNEGSTDIFKGVAARDVEIFKASTTPETHDMNLGKVLDAVNGYHSEFNRYPSTMEELVKTGHLQKPLYGPKGKKYAIDPKSGEITLQ